MGSIGARAPSDVPRHRAGGRRTDPGARDAQAGEGPVITKEIDMEEPGQRHSRQVAADNVVDDA
jgi:hypothetical protein